MPKLPPKIKQDLRASVADLEAPVFTGPPAPPPELKICPEKLLDAWNNNYQTMLGVIDLVNSAIKLAKYVVIPLCLFTLAILGVKEYADHQRAEALQVQMAHLNTKGGDVMTKLDTFTGDIKGRFDRNEKRLALVVEAMVKTNEAEMTEAESNQTMRPSEARVLKRKAATHRAEALASSLVAQEAVVVEPKKKAQARTKLKQLRTASKARGLDISF